MCRLQFATELAAQPSSGGAATAAAAIGAPASAACPLPDDSDALEALLALSGNNGTSSELPAPGKAPGTNHKTADKTDSARYFCPFPGCNRSFAELWRLKVHYRAPPNIRGSGKERGHGMRLTHCPKCGAALKVGGHHVKCAAVTKDAQAAAGSKRGRRTQQQQQQAQAAPQWEEQAASDAAGGSAALCSADPAAAADATTEQQQQHLMSVMLQQQLFAHEQQQQHLAVAAAAAAAAHAAANSGPQASWCEPPAATAASVKLEGAAADGLQELRTGSSSDASASSRQQLSSRSPSGSGSGGALWGAAAAGPSTSSGSGSADDTDEPCGSAAVPPQQQAQAGDLLWQHMLLQHLQQHVASNPGTSLPHLIQMAAALFGPKVDTLVSAFGVTGAPASEAQPGDSQQQQAELMALLRG